MKYLAIAGTNGWRDNWTHDDSPFGTMMAAEGFESLLCDGRRFRWSTALDGLLGDDREWEAAADALYYFLRLVPLEDRNLIAHSHGGQLPLILAASGFPLRSLTTVGTPPRADVPVTLAQAHIGLHQHIYDMRRDWMGWLGQIGERELRFDRTYRDPKVLNLGVDRISHSKVLRDPEFIPLWPLRGWLANIRRGTGGGS
jgi:hypothetical protein